MLHTILRSCLGDSQFCSNAMDQMSMPDVSGYKLEKATELLASNGFHKIDVRFTASPRTRQAGYDSNSRVVRQSISSDDTVILLVTQSALASERDIPCKGI